MGPVTFATIVLALFAVFAVRASLRNTRESLAALQDSLDRSEGTLSPAFFSLAQDVIEDHLPGAEDAGRVSLDYGDLGRLDVHRVRPVTGPAGYRLVWHRRGSTPKLDLRLARFAPHADQDGDTVEIPIEDDYFSLNQRLEDLFLALDDENMTLTWCARPHAATKGNET